MQTDSDYKMVFDLKTPDVTLAGMVKRRADESQAHWNKKYNLDKVRKDNEKLYLTEYIKDWLIDKRYESIFADNRLFVATRTVLPFITGRLTQPEVVPANGSDVAIQFGQDFERVMVELATQAYARDKVKLALQDLLSGQRLGVCKWVYNPGKDCLELVHIDPKSIVIDGKTPLHQEPKFIQETQRRTLGELIRTFPDKQDMLFKALNIQKGVPSQLEKTYKITENWMFIDDEKGNEELVIVWMYQNEVLGKMTDPNYNPDKENVIDYPMMPYVFFNFLNDGSGYIDNTSFIEQAQYSQKNYDRRGQTISENAEYGGTGVPIFGKDAITAKTAAKIQFSPKQRIMLEQTDVSKSFAVWNTGPLPQYIVEDKMDLRSNVDNIYGINNISRAEASNNNTLGQDLLLRDQSAGRLQELIDCVDNGMQRFYLLEGQMVYRYFDEDQFYNFIGDDGKFEEIVISQKTIAKNTGIKIMVKAGTSLPVDREQKRATAIELLKMDRLGTLRAYKELGLDDPEDAFKEYVLEKVYPMGLLNQVEDDLFDRQAEQDLITVIGGEEPPERDDITDTYINHLNEYLLTDKFSKLKKDEQKRVADFLQNVVMKAQNKVQKLSQQQPTGLKSDIPSVSDMMKMNLHRTMRENLDYKDTPPDVQRQIEEQAGLQPSQMGSVTPTPSQEHGPIAPGGIPPTPQQGVSPESNAALQSLISAGLVQ